MASSDRYRPAGTLAGALRQLDDLRALVARISPDDIGLIWRRCAEGADPDGYPAHASGSNLGGGNASSALPSTSVERAVMARQAKAEPDPVARWGEEFFTMLAQATMVARGMEGRRIAIAQITTQRDRVAMVPDCVNCGEPAIWSDRRTAKSGRCPRCYNHRYARGHEWRDGCCLAAPILASGESD